MHKRNQEGSAANLAVIIILAVLVVGISIFALSAYSTGQDYRNNSDKKAAAAVEEAKAQQAKELQAKFDEEYKKPNLTYKGPVAYGSVTFDYPKTWSAMVTEGDSELLNGYFYPQVVPGTDSDTAFALRVEVVDTPYSQVVEQYESEISTGKLKARAYIPPKMEKAANIQPGLRYDGDFSDGQTPKDGSMVVIPVRDKTLKIYTEAVNFRGDFDNTILPSLTFSP
jgi:hypothetical protein